MTYKDIEDIGKIYKPESDYVPCVLIKVKWTLYINKGGKSVFQADLEEAGSKGGIRLVWESINYDVTLQK